MHELMATAMEKAIESIKQIQRNARTNYDSQRPRWPMIVLKIAQGLDGTEGHRWA